MQRWVDSLDVVAMVMVVRWWGLYVAHVTELCVKCLDLGGPPLQLA